MFASRELRFGHGTRQSRRLSWLGFCLWCCTLLCGQGLRAADSNFKTGNWPFRPLTRPAVPADITPSASNPLDRFVMAKLAEQKLSLSPPADKRMWLRRVTYDLTGLLPTNEELNAFLNDQQPQAYERVVDRLLASPRYGEHWAKGWLDLVRFSETAGYKIDELRPEAYRYRDYIVRALNNDLPYDRFIQQQLAGDELEPENPEAIIATGYNRLYAFESNTSNFRKARQDVLDDMTEVTGFVFMGLTIGCARCHDHKFDPIEQEDFFRLQAVFSPLLQRDDLPAAPQETVSRYKAQESEWIAITHPIRTQMETLINTVKGPAMTELTQAIDAETGAAMLKVPEKRTPLERQLAALSSRMYTKKMNRLPAYLEGESKAEYAALQKELSTFDKLKPAPLPLTMAVTDVEGKPPETHLLEGGNFLRPVAATLEPGTPEFLGEDDLDADPPALRPESTGRRAALAMWLTRPNHPLTARVWMNRVWQQHFGVGIVPTANDFGLMGESATHPEMLDWLASEFVANGWKLKPIHRLIVLSQTYRQTSAIDPQSDLAKAASTVDPNNHLLWHFRRQRMSGEAIRDVVLQLSGRLNPRMYGPSGKPALPAELSSSRYYWDADASAEDQNRRTIYTFTRRNLRLPILTAFDPPDLITSCSKRNCTVTAPQALTLLNSEFTLSEARYWSGQLLAEHGTDQDALIKAAFQQAFHRKPTAVELCESREFLHDQAEVISEDEHEIDAELLPTTIPQGMSPPQAAAAADFCHALLNASELLFVD
jgi:hypothetical protein